MGLSYTPEARAERAQKRARDLDRLVGLRSQRVLEVGCGLGDLCRVLMEDYDCSVVGVDVMAHDSWNEFKVGPNLQFVTGDISQSTLCFEEKSFDRIISFVAWEHIIHPWSALKNCQQLLKDDGKKYLYAWLYGSTKASHLYDITDDHWPHLIYSPSEIKARYNFGELPWYFWCNRLSLQHYLFYFRQLGFVITHQVLLKSEIDERAYAQHAEILRLYPHFDLTTDAFQVVLEFDRENPRVPIADPVYRLG